MLSLGAALAMILALGAAQTPSETYAGPTATGSAPFLAQTNPVLFGPSMTYLANMPLETAETIPGNSQDQNIFRLMGNMSPYFSSPVGFGVQEYPLPPGANITQVQVGANLRIQPKTKQLQLCYCALQVEADRDSLRCCLVTALDIPPPAATFVSNIMVDWTVRALTRSISEQFGDIIKNNTGKFNATGPLSFLNTWKYELGAEILVPSGREELFSNGVLHYYNYGRLYDPATKIVARTTSEDRMVKSAENFLAGFFGLDWTQNATLEVIVESVGFNNSLASFYSCNNSLGVVNTGGSNASAIWIATYLQNATQRLQSMVTGLNWTLADTYAAQTLCVYETVRIQPLYRFMTKFVSSGLPGLQCLLSALHVPGI